MNKSFIGILILIVGIFSFAFWKLSEKSSNDTIKSDSETTNTVNTNENGVVGYVIINTNSVYFIHEKDLPENIQWNEMEEFMGHPSDYVLFGQPVEAISNELHTGAKVKIWYSQVLETYPARIKIDKIKKL